MKLVSKLAVTAVVVLAASSSSARPEYRTGVPNGTACGTCHVNSAGGGPRNDFGADVEKSMPFSGPNDATWAALFCVDSDGDGKTNGQELGDPCGTWKIGDSSPEFAETNPGDDAETTPEDGECDGATPESCDLVLPEDAGSCASSSTSTSLAGLFVLGLLVRRRRQR